MINHKIAEPSIQTVTGYFITNLSFILPMNEFLKSVNIWQKLQAKWLIVSYAPFALDFCPQRCRTRWISKITCLLLTETVTDCCYVNRQINVSLLSTNIKLLWTSLTYWLTDLCHQRLTDCSSWMAFCCNISLCYSSCVQSIMAFFMAGVNIFLLVN